MYEFQTIRHAEPGLTLRTSRSDLHGEVGSFTAHVRAEMASLDFHSRCRLPYSGGPGIGTLKFLSNFSVAHVHHGAVRIFREFSIREDTFPAGILSTIRHAEDRIAAGHYSIALTPYFDAYYNLAMERLDYLRKTLLIYFAKPALLPKQAVVKSLM